MARILLVSNASHDVQTSYLDAWSANIFDYAKSQKDITFFELKGHKATKKELTELIEREKPNLIIFNGHGESDTIKGFNYEVLVKCDENEVLLKNKIVHAMACDAGRELGQKSIAIGTLAYIGYTQKFKLACEKILEKEDQLEDEYAGFILEPAFEAVLALIQGTTAKEAYDRSQKKSIQVLRILLTKTNPALNRDVASQLFHNLKHQVLLGDPTVRF